MCDASSASHQNVDFWPFFTGDNVTIAPWVLVLAIDPFTSSVFSISSFSKSTYLLFMYACSYLTVQPTKCVCVRYTCVCADGSCLFIVCFWLCPHSDDSASESSETELHGGTMSGLEVKQADQRMDISGSTTTPSGSTTTPSPTCDPSITVGNFMWLTDIFKSIK